MKTKWILFTIICMGMVLCAGCQQGKYSPVTVESMQVQTEGQEAEISQEGMERTVSQNIGPGETQAAAPEETTAATEDDGVARQVEQHIASMTLEEKVAQFFVILPESLMDVGCVTAAGEATKKAIDQIPVGGFIYMQGNLVSSDQVKSMLSNVQDYSMARLGIPAFLSVDEEGGTVTRISRTGRFDVPDIGNMSEIGKTQDVERARQTGTLLGGYLSDLGFNVDFAPVADVLSNPDNKVVKSRSFGEDPQLVAQMSLALAAGLKEKGIISAFKHFPGHGATAGDTHAGYAYTEKNLEQLKQCELIPFQKAVEQNAGFIMVGHISLPNVTGDHTPASLSPVIIGEILRGQMGYDGVVITDAMNMGAIVQQYSSSEAAVKALLAGVDIILMPKDFKEAYQGVIDAVNNGTLSMERIDQSLRRILTAKLQMGQ